MILRHSYTRSRATARAALRYYQLRPRGEGEPPRALFGTAGTMTRAEAERLLAQVQATKKYPGANIRRMRAGFNGT